MKGSVKSTQDHLFDHCAVFRLCKWLRAACTSVALTAEGDVYTCGVNDEGALGRETSACFHIMPSAP